MGGRRRKGRPTAAPPQDQRPKTASGKNGASATVLLAGTDTAIKLLNDIKAHRLDPRDLTRSQRRSCLMLLANGSQTSTELAATFRTSPGTIRKDLKAIREEVGREVREWSTSEVVGQLALMAEKTTASAMKQEDPGLAWTIQRDFAKMLKELGVIRPEVDQSGFRLTVEAIGTGYDKAREALTLAMNPTLTGQLPPKEHPVQDLPGPTTLDAEFAVPQVGGDTGTTSPPPEGLAVPQTPPRDPAPDHPGTGPKPTFPGLDAAAMGY